MNTVQTKARRKRGTTTPRYINVRRITNPFEPLGHVETDKWVWKRRKSLDAYLPAVTVVDAVVSVNGAIIQKEDFASTYVKADDYVVICPVPCGSGGKMIFRVVAMIAVAVASAYTGGAAAAAYGGMGTVAGATAGFAASAAVTIAGSLLVNAILPPVTPTNNSGSLDSSSSYGADGAKNTSAEGVPVPVSYGTYRTAGNIIGLYTELDGSGSDASNGGNNQILYMLINAGEGPIASITDVLINDRPAAEFTNITLQQRLGYSAQSPIDWFSKVITPVNKNQELPADGGYLMFSTVEECEQIRFDFACPNGLYSVDTKTGGFNNNTVALEIDYRQVGTTSWTGMGPTQTVYREIVVTPTVNGVLDPLAFDKTLVITGLTVTNADGTPATAADTAEAMSRYGQWIGKTMDSWPSTYNFHVSFTLTSVSTTGNILITDKLRSAVRRSFSSPTLPLAKYEMRVRRNVDYTVQTVNNYINTIQSSFPQDTSDTAMSDCYVTDINEITFDGVAYNNTALLAVRVQMDEQLSGVPTVTFQHGGKLVSVINRNDGVDTVSQVASSSPAWIWFDMATNAIYGAGFSADRIDIDSIIAWDQYCTQASLEWNGPLDQLQTFWDASALVFRVGHAQVIQTGTRYYVATEAPADPVMMFGMGNIIKDSFKMTWLGMKDRATEVDVTYFDNTDSNKAKTVKIQDSTLALNAAQQNVSAITLYGVDNIKTAYREGAFQLNLNRYLTQSVSFDAPVEAIACTPGDVVLVQHDMPAWATSGRLDAGCTNTTLVLDKPVTMEAGKAYKALLLTNYVIRTTGRIQTVIGSNFIQIVGGSGVTSRVLRIRAGNGAEAAIHTVVPDGVYVDDTAGFVAGDTLQLIDTDVVTDADVNTVAGDSISISLQTPLSYAPDQFTNYMFGESTKVRRPFRVKSITLASSTYNRTIEALEYNDAVYDLSAYDGVLGTLTPPLLDPSQAAIGEVQNLSVYEESYVSGTNILSDVRAAWSNPIVGSYAGADVYVQINGGAFNLAATIPSSPTYVVTGTHAGDLVAVKVVAYDLWGKRASYDNAPVQSYKVIGQVSSLQVADVTGVNFIWAGRDCKIFWNYNSVTGSFEFGSEPSGADSGARDPHFLDYQIQIYDSTGLLLRTEHTTDNNYTYSYEKNFADGLHRRLTFHIASRDIFNNVGAPAVLDAYNPPPTITSVNTNAAFDRIQINFTTSGDPDYAGTLVYLAWEEAVSVDPKFLAYDGPDTQVLLTNLMFNSDYQFILAPYDAFGKSELIPTAVFSVHTPYMDVEAIADGVLKDSQLIPALQTRINLIDADATVPGSVNARVSTETDNRVAGDTALGSRIDTVAAKSDTNFAAIQTETDARVAGDSANASQITTLQSTVGSNTAAIQTAMTSVNGLSAQYTVKIDNNGYVSGFGLASYPVNGVTVSEFAVRTDTFSVNLPGYPGVHPFTIGAVYGVPRVIISNALIGDASIDNAKIGDAQITSAKIADAQINTAHIGIAQIDTLRIGANAVSTLASWTGLGNSTVQYSAAGGNLLVMIGGNCGSHTNADGGTETAGQAVVTINGQQLFIVDGSGGYVTNFAQMSAPAGVLNVQTSVTNASNITVAIFEAKR
jgi:predicted phage tail protein